MTNPLYHIKKQEDQSFDAALCTLVIQVDTNGLFLLLLAEKQLVELSYYRLEYDDMDALLADLEEILNSSAATDSSFRKITTIFNWPDSSLVPDKLFSPDTNRDIIEMVHGDLQKGTILSEQVNGFDMHNVYRVPSQLHEYLLQRFPSAGIWHFNTLWLDSIKDEPVREQDVLRLLIYPGYFLVLVSRAGKILLTQRFTYETDDDVHFYLLTLFQTLKLDKLTTEVLVSGFVFEDSALLNTFRRFLGNVHLSGPGLSSSPGHQVTNYPEHFFSPILNLGRCVS